jgi:hypothetical protein
MSVPEEKLFIKEEVKEPTILDWIMTQDVLSSQVILGLVIILISTAFMFFHLYTGFFGQPEAHLFRSVHLTFVFMLTFLFYPLGRKSWKDKLNGWFLIDLLGILLSIATQVYYLADPDEFIVRIADPSTWDMIMGTMVILLVMETARRVIGNTMVILSAFFLLHALYADKFFGFCPPVPLFRHFPGDGRDGYLHNPPGDDRILRGPLPHSGRFSSPHRAWKVLSQHGFSPGGQAHRRAWKGLGGLFGSLRDHFRKRRCQCDGRRGHHDTGHETHGLSTGDGRRHRSAGLVFRHVHPARHGRRGFYYRLPGIP